MIVPDTIVRLDVELPAGDEIITETDDRLLDTLSTSPLIVLDEDELWRRAGDRSLVRLLGDLPTAEPSWIGSLPLAALDPRTYAAIPARSGIIEADGFRIDMRLGGAAPLRWLDPAFLGLVTIDERGGVPVVELIPRRAQRTGGSIALESTSGAMQTGGGAELDSYVALHALLATVILDGRVDGRVTFDRTALDLAAGSGDREVVAEAWGFSGHGQREAGGLTGALLLAGRSGEQTGRASESFDTRFAGLRHERSFGDTLAGVISVQHAETLHRNVIGREREERDGVEGEVRKLLLLDGVDHELRAALTLRDGDVGGNDYGTTALVLEDRIAGRWFTARAGARASEVEYLGGRERSIDPYFDAAARLERVPLLVGFSAGSRQLDAEDLAGETAGEELRYASLRIERRLGEWSSGEIGIALNELRGANEADARWLWVSAERRHSSGYGLRTFARLIDSDHAVDGARWSAGGEFSIEVPGGWGLAATGDVREGIGGADTVSNVDLRVSRSIPAGPRITTRLWGDVRNLFDRDGVAVISDGLSVERQPLTLILGGMVSF